MNALAGALDSLPGFHSSTEANLYAQMVRAEVHDFIPGAPGLKTVNTLAPNWEPKEWHFDLGEKSAV